MMKICLWFCSANRFVTGQYAFHPSDTFFVGSLHPKVGKFAIICYVYECSVSSVLRIRRPTLWCWCGEAYNNGVNWTTNGVLYV